MATIPKIHLRLLAAACLVVAALVPAPAAADTPTELFFSEYIEGSSNNKALEIYNGTGAAIDLAAGGYNVQMFFNGSVTAGLTINLTGTVAAGDVYVVAHSSATAVILAQADQTNGSGWFNGDDVVVLRRGTTVVDVIGQIGFDPGSEWGTGLASTADNTLRRADTICAGDPDGSDAFDPSAEWDGFATDTFNGLGAHTANCTPPPPPVINEFSASTAGTDVEYIEIFGPPLTNLSQYTILEIEGDVSTAAGTIDEVIALGTTDANGLYLVSLPANALENGTITLLLVKSFTGSLNADLDTNNDGVFDLTPWDEIVDAVAVNDGGAGDLTYGVPVLGVAYDGLAFAPGGASRIPDGLDTNTATDWVRNDFDLAGIPGFTGTPVVGEAFNTPGALNQAVTPPETAPGVASTFPANGAADVPTNANISITFSEPVNVADPWFTLTCSVSGAKTAAVTGGPTTFTINPDTDFVGGESCTLTIIAANVSDQDSNDPPDNMVANFVLGFTVFDVCAQPYTPIPEIQGSGATVALTGTRTTQGVVVGDYEGPFPALRGFFIQDALGDGNPATSDGIFVFEGSNANTVSLGDLVRVTGTAGENQGQSQISVGTIVKCGTGTVTPTDVTFPAPSNDFLEQYEGMLVRLPQTLYVTEHFQLGRFGQVVLSAGGRLQQPTDVVEPGAPAQALQAENNLNRIILDDASQSQNPDPIVFARGGLPLSASNTLRGGDTATGIVGVLNYTWAGNSASGNAYRVRPINALNGYVYFEPANPRPDARPEVGGMVRVASMNLLNYFNTFDGLPDTVDNCALGAGGAATDCRGADTAAEFGRQWVKTVSAIVKLDADIVGLIELENDGYAPDSAIADLVDKLNAATAPGTYAFVNADAGTGQVNALGTDAIKVGLIYRPAVVSPVGTTAALNTEEFVNGGDSEPRNRPALAQAFEHNLYGARFVVAVNHLKSKGSACDAPDAGDGQGNCNAVRANAATALAAWLATDPTGAGDPDVLLVGDFNSYSKEDPIDVLAAAGFTDLAPVFAGPTTYTYVFDGQWGSLDHTLSSPTLLGQVTGVGAYHINADEPSVLDYNTDFKSASQIASLYAPDEFRVADHDPLVVGLTPVVTFTGTDKRDDIVGTDGPDRIYGGRGGDTLTGKGGPDVFVYTDIRDANDTVTDFNPGDGDVIDLSALLRAAGYPGGDAIADGWVRVLPADGKFMVQVDLDGPGLLYEFRQLLVVKGPPKGYVFTAADFVF